MKKNRKSYLFPIFVFLILFSISLSYTYISPYLIKVAKIVDIDDSNFFLDLSDPILSLKAAGGAQFGKDVNTTSGRFCIGSDCISSWNSLSGIPSGYCVLFYNATCPSGFDLKENLTGSNFEYKLPIIITDTSGSTLTDYQVNITIDTQSLITTSKMRSDCGDIRFYTENDESIPYWIEDGTCNTPNTNIWVKVPEIPASGSVTIYMYYGNPSATSESNIDNTFIFGDDFEDGVLDASKWTFVSYNGGSYSENNGYIELIDDSGVEESATIHSYGKYNIGADTVLEYKAQYNIIGSPPYGNVRYGLFFTGDFGSKSVPIYYYGTWWNPYSGSSGSLLSSNGSSIATFTRPDMGVDFRGKLIIASNGDVKYYINNNLVASANDYPLNKTSGGVVLALAHNGDSMTGYNRIYWVFVRKYSSSEPTVSIGTEQPNEPDYKVICCKQ